MGNVQRRCKEKKEKKIPNSSAPWAGKGEVETYIIQGGQGKFRTASPNSFRNNHGIEGAEGKRKPTSDNLRYLF